MHAWSLTENSLYTFHTDKYAYKLALTSNYRSFDEGVPISPFEVYESISDFLFNI